MSDKIPAGAQRVADMYRHSIVHRDQLAAAIAREVAPLVGALEEAQSYLEALWASRSDCGDPDAECPLQDMHKLASSPDGVHARVEAEVASALARWKEEV